MSLIPNPELKSCPVCNKRPARIWMRNYAQLVGDNVCGDLILCDYCALQLSRKLIEDLCELAGDRHG